MTATRRNRPVPPQLEITRRLVANVPEPEHGEGAYGPVDGEPVSIPTPCLRVLAGYWCSCGGSFWSGIRHSHVVQARVEVARGHWQGYVDRNDGGWNPNAYSATEMDEIELQRTLEGLPVGTVVERHGIGVAVAFDRPAPSYRTPLPALPDAWDTPF